MSIQASEPKSSDSQHWYSKDGLPRYTIVGSNGKERNTTLRDARKEGLVPSVTTIIKVAANHQLNTWMQKQVLMAALTLSRIEGETENDFIERIIQDSKQQGRDAANIGTEIHNAIQAFYEAKNSTAYVPHTQGCVNALKAHYGDVAWVSERSFGHEMGFGGKCDLYVAENDGIVVDIKTKDFSVDDKVDIYESHAMQLAAYRVGLGLPNAKCAIIFVSRNNPGVAKIIELTEEQVADAWLMFYHLLVFWQIKNKHKPC
jgi:hypothetical protein